MLKFRGGGNIKILGKDSEKDSQRNLEENQEANGKGVVSNVKPYSEVKKATGRDIVS